MNSRNSVKVFCESSRSAEDECTRNHRRASKYNYDLNIARGRAMAEFRLVDDRRVALQRGGIRRQGFDLLRHVVHDRARGGNGARFLGQFDLGVARASALGSILAAGLFPKVKVICAGSGQASGLQRKIRWDPFCAEVKSHFPGSGARVVMRTLPGLTGSLSSGTWPEAAPPMKIAAQTTAAETGISMAHPIARQTA